MKKLSLFLLLITWLCIPNVKANTCADTLYLVGKKCYINNKKVTQAELGVLLKSFPETKTAYDSYLNKVGRSIMLSSATGFIFGYGISPFLFPVTSNFNQTVHLVMVGAGLGGLAWSIHLEEQNQQALKAVISSYNKAWLLKCATP